MKRTPKEAKLSLDQIQKQMKFEIGEELGERGMSEKRQIQEMEIVPQEEYEIKQFNIEDFKDLNDQYENGQQLINVTATSILFKVLSKIFQEVNNSLDVLTTAGSLDLAHIKRFVIWYSKLDLSEYIIYSAF